MSSIVSDQRVRFSSYGPAYLYESNGTAYRFDRTSPHIGIISKGGRVYSPGTMFVVEVEAHGTAAASNSKVIVATRDSYTAEYKASIEVVGAVGTVAVHYDFTSSPPKVTGSFAPSDENLVFNLAWSVATTDSHAGGASSKGASLAPFSSGSLVPLSLPERKVEVFPAAAPDASDERLILDWVDANSGEAFAGQVQVGDKQSHGILVRFPTMQRVVDPEIIVGSHSSLKFAYAYQRRLVQHDGVYFAFYLDWNSYISYRSSLGAATQSGSGSGWAWSAETVTSYGGSGSLPIYESAGFDVDIHGDDVYVAWAPPATVQGTPGDGTHKAYIAKGIVNGRTIDWVAQGEVTEASTGDDIVGAKTLALSLAIGPDGIAWLALSLYSEDYPMGTQWTLTHWSITVFRAPSKGALPASSLNELSHFRKIDGTSGSPSSTSKWNAILSSLPDGGIMLMMVQRGHTSLWSARLYPGMKLLDTEHTNVVDTGNQPVPYFSDQGALVSAVGLPNGTVYVSHRSALSSPPLAISRLRVISPPPPASAYEKLTTEYVSSSCECPRMTSIMSDPAGEPVVLSADNIGTRYLVRAPDSSWSESYAFGNDYANNRAWAVATPRVSSSHLYFLFLAEGAYNPLKFGALPLPIELSTSLSRPWASENAGAGGGISPGNGLLALTEEDHKLPGRGFDLSVRRVFVTPRSADVYGIPTADDEVAPIADMGTGTARAGWRLDLPWIGKKYLHLPGGQTYLIRWEQRGIDMLFENHQGTPFRLWLKTASAKCEATNTQCFLLELPNGVTIRFGNRQLGQANPPPTWRFPEKMTDPAGNDVIFTYTPCTGCVWPMLSTIKTVRNPTNSAYYRYYYFDYDPATGLLDRVRQVGTPSVVVDYDYATIGGKKVLSEVRVPTDPNGAVGGPELVTQYEYFTDIGGKKTPPLIRRISHPAGGRIEYSYKAASVGTDSYTWLTTAQTTFDKDGRVLSSLSYSYEVTDGWVTKTTVKESDKGAVRTSTTFANDALARSSRVIARDGAGVRLGEGVTWIGRNGHADAQEAAAGPASQSVSQTWNFDGSPFGFVHDRSISKLTPQAASAGVAWDAGTNRVVVTNTGKLTGTETFVRRIPKMTHTSQFTFTSELTIVQMGTSVSMSPLFVGPAGSAPGDPGTLSIEMNRLAPANPSFTVRYVDLTGFTQFATASALQTTTYPFKSEIAYDPATKVLTLRVNKMDTSQTQVVRVDYPFGIAVVDGFAVEQAGMALWSATVEYGTFVTKLGVDNMALAGTAVPENLVVESKVDAYGNPVYSRSPQGQETFASFGNLDSRGVLRAPGRLDRLTSGLMFNDDFDDENLWQYTTGGPWRTGGGAASTAKFEQRNSKLTITLPSGSTATNAWTRSEQRFATPLYLELHLEVPSVGAGGTVEAMAVITDGTSTSVDDPFAGNSNAIRLNISSDASGAVTHKVSEKTGGGSEVGLYQPVASAGAARSVKWRLEFTKPGLVVRMDDGTGMKAVLSTNSAYSATSSRLFLNLRQAGNSALTLPTVWAKFDYVAVDLSPFLTISNVATEMYASLSDIDGRIVNSAKMTSSSVTWLTLSAYGLSGPEGILRVYDRHMTLQAETPIREVHGGDVYRYSPGVLDLKGRFSLTSSLLSRAPSGLQVIVDETVPGTRKAEGPAGYTDSLGVYRGSLLGGYAYAKYGQKGSTGYEWKARTGSSSAKFGVRILANTPTGGASDGYVIYQNGATLEVRVGTATSATCSTPNVNPSGWHTYVVTVDAPAKKITAQVDYSLAKQVVCTFATLDSSGSYFALLSDGSATDFDYFRARSPAGTTVREWAFDADPEGMTSGVGNWEWGTSFGENSEQWDLMSNLANALSGNVYHRSRPMPGTHKHYYEDSTQVDIADKYIVQFVKPRSDAMPAGLMMEFRDEYGEWSPVQEGGRQRVHWGTNPSTLASWSMGALNFTPDRWNMLVIPGNLLVDCLHCTAPILVTGISWTLHGGAADWDLTAVGTDPGQLTVEGISPLYSGFVKVLDERGCVRATGSFYNGGARPVKIDLTFGPQVSDGCYLDPDDRVISIFPFRASIEVWRSDITPAEPIFRGPLTEIWGGDVYSVAPDFNKDEVARFDDRWIVDRLLGELEYQNGRGPPPAPTTPLTPLTPGNVPKEVHFQYDTANTGLPVKVTSIHEGSRVDTLIRYDSSNSALCGLQPKCFGQPVMVTGPNGYTTSYVYPSPNGFAMPTQASTWAQFRSPENPGSSIRTDVEYGMSYRPLATKVKDHGGNFTSYTYDALGRILTTTYGCGTGSCPSPPVTTYSYDDVAGVVSTSGDAPLSRSYRDGLGRMVRTETRDRNMIGSQVASYSRVQYDSRGQIVASADLADSMPPVSEFDFCKYPRDFASLASTWTWHSSSCKYGTESTSASNNRAFANVPQDGTTTYEWTVDVPLGGTATGYRWGMTVFDYKAIGATSYTGVLITQTLSYIRVYKTTDQVPASSYLAQFNAASASGQSYNYRVMYDPTDPANVRLHIWRNDVLIGTVVKTSADFPTSGTRIGLFTSLAHAHFSNVKVKHAESSHKVAEWTFRTDAAGFVGTSSDGQPWIHSPASGIYRSPATNPSLALSSVFVRQERKMTFEVTIRVSDGAPWSGAPPPGVAVGIYFFSAGTDGTTSYLLQQSPTTLSIIEYTSSSTSTVGSWTSAFSDGGSARYRVTYDPGAGKFDVWKDGRFVGTASDSTPKTSGAYVILRTFYTAAQFDDVKVYAGTRAMNSVTWGFESNPPDWTKPTGAWAWKSPGALGQDSITETNANAYARVDQSGVSTYDLAATMSGYSDAFTWSDRAPATAPTARYGHAMAYDSESDRIILFGGSTSSGASAETWAFDADNNTWTKMNPATPPSARYIHAMVYDSWRDRIVLFGGYTGSARLDDTWAYDFNTDSWAHVEPVPPAQRPSPRYSHAMAFDANNGFILLYGGSTSSAVTSDTWSFHLGFRVWKNEPTTANPGPRYRHAMAYDSQSAKVVLFGGRDGSIVHSTTWTYDWGNFKWVQQTTIGSPTARMQHSMAYDARNDRIILFGGCTTVSGCSSTTPYKSDTWVYRFDGTQNAWTQVTPSTVPPVRGNAAMAYDALSARVVMFGGQYSSSSSYYRADTWAHEIDSALGLHIFASDASQTQRGNSYLVSQTVSGVEVHKSLNNSLAQKAQFPRANIANGASFAETHSYKVTYDPRAGQIAVWRDGKFVGEWTDTDPLRGGQHISFRTTTAIARFDSVSTTSGILERVTRTDYDALGRPVKVTNPNGTYTSATFDDLQRTVKVKDENQHFREVVSDSGGRPVETREYVDATHYFSVHTFYDLTGNILRVANHSVDIVKHRYDNWDLLIETNFPDGTSETQTYDNYALPRVFTNRRGHTATSTYDSFMRLWKVNRAEDGSWTEYKRDYGHVVEVFESASGGSSALRYGYDYLGRTTSEQLDLMGGTAYTVGYGYNNDGTVSRITYPQMRSGGGGCGCFAAASESAALPTAPPVVRYSYDDVALTTAVADDTIAAAGLYGVLGWIGNRPDGLAASTSYISPGTSGPVHVARIFDSIDLNGRLDRRYARSGATTPALLDLSYWFDASGNTIRSVSREGTPTSTSVYQDNHGYDWLDRLTSAGGTRYGTLAWTYDNAGNRLTETAGTTTLTYSYGAYNTLEAVKNGAATTIDYVYQPTGGRLAQKIAGTSTWTFAYDSTDRLVQVTKGLNVDYFHYDAAGRRVSVQRTTQLSSTSTIFMYASLGVLSEVSTSTSGTEDVAYYYVNGAQFAKKRVDPANVAALQYYVQDGLGSTRMLLDSSGTALSYLAYKPFGAEATATSPERLKFAGEQMETSGTVSGLVYLHSRYYDPETGKFITPDSVLGSPLAPQTLNRYGYVTNNPLRYTDPTGRLFFLVGLFATMFFMSAVPTQSEYGSAQWAGDSAGFVTGFIVAAAVGVAVAAICSTGIGCLILAGALAGAAGYLADRTVEWYFTGTPDYSWEGLAEAMILGAAFGALFEGAAALKAARGVWKARAGGRASSTEATPAAPESVVTQAPPTAKGRLLSRYIDAGEVAELEASAGGGRLKPGTKVTFPLNDKYLGREGYFTDFKTTSASEACRACGIPREHPPKIARIDVEITEGLYLGRYQTLGTANEFLYIRPLPAKVVGFAPLEP